MREGLVVPELPDIEGFRRLVESRVRDAQILGVEVVNSTILRGVEPLELAGALVGHTIDTARRHGKWLFVDTDGPTLVMHFGMTGALRWQPLHQQPSPLERVIVATSRGCLVFSDRRNLGTLAVVSGAASTELVTGPLAPDALDIDPDELGSRMGSSRRTAKATLLDQSVVAGLGNMLTDEVLWRANIDPARPARGISDAEVSALHRAMRRMLRDAVRAGHIPRGRTWLAGARAEDAPSCPRCRTRLERRRLGGRTSLSCPHCQPAVAPDRTARLAQTDGPAARGSALAPDHQP